MTAPVNGHELAASELLAVLPAEALERLAARGARRRFTAGDTLFEEGDESQLAARRARRHARRRARRGRPALAPAAPPRGRCGRRAGRARPPSPHRDGDRARGLGDARGRRRRARRGARPPSRRRAPHARRAGAAPHPVARGGHARQLGAREAGARAHPGPAPQPARDRLPPRPGRRVARPGDRPPHHAHDQAVRAPRRGRRDSPEECEALLHAAPMHDIGKVGVPDSILHKAGPLEPGEWETMRRHTTIGAEILTGSRSPVVRMAEVVALTHHERWDGSGYPRGLAGEEIPLVGRICAVADVFELRCRPGRTSLRGRSTKPSRNWNAGPAPLRPVGGRAPAGPPRRAPGDHRGRRAAPGRRAGPGPLAPDTTGPQAQVRRCWDSCAGSRRRSCSPPSSPGSCCIRSWRDACGAGAVQPVRRRRPRVGRPGRSQLAQLTPVHDAAGDAGAGAAADRGVTGESELLPYSSRFEAVLYFYAAGAMIRQMTPTRGHS